MANIQIKDRLIRLLDAEYQHYIPILLKRMAIRERGEISIPFFIADAFMSGEQNLTEMLQPSSNVIELMP